MVPAITGFALVSNVVMCAAIGCDFSVVLRKRTAPFFMPVSLSFCPSLSLPPSLTHCVSVTWAAGSFTLISWSFT